MSWLLNLYRTYEENEDRIGEIEKKRNGKEFTLLPLSHTTQTAHIEVRVTENGNFHSAEVITGDDAVTLIPTTEESSNRAGSKIAPYPLHDKLSYVAGDFLAFGGKIKKEEPFSSYIHKLEEWAKSPSGHSKVKSIYSYLKKRTLIQDLVNENILYLNVNNKLIGKWEKKHEQLHGNKPPIFAVATGGQESAFVRFTVHSPKQIQIKVWNDREMFQSFIEYYRDALGEEDICFVTGENLPSTKSHANKIRHAGDKAKLISANDNSGFTYRGRFKVGSDAASISYDASQKAHNALKWLINRQGKTIDQRVFLVWANDNLDIADPTEDSFSFFTAPQVNNQKLSDTYKEFANQVSRALDGYKNDLNTKSEVNILVLDSATTGRMAVLYYRNMNKELYLNRLKKWHATCSWHHRYQKDEAGKAVQFIGAPATKDIGFAAYGPRANEKIIKGLMERILPCIIDDQNIPRDIVRSATNRASNPVAMEKWEWEKTLSITCALINRQEGYNVALDTENYDRSYLFGRLLAIADVLERRALGREESRATNAIRYMNSFSRHPERTWKTIQSSLQPYQAKLGNNGRYFASLIDDVASKISFEEFNNKPLSGKYLLGFYSQRHALYQKKEDSVLNQEDNN